MALFTAIVSAVTAISTFVGTLGAIGSLILRTAVGLGVSLLAQKLQGKPEAPTFSIQGKMNTGEDVPRSFVLGYAATAGSLVYSNEWGTLNKTPNAYHVQVIALSDLPVDSLAEVFVNGELVTLIRDEPHPDRGFPVLEYRDDNGNVHDYLWIKFYDGTQTAADPYLVACFGDLEERKYESTRVGTGMAYAICTARVEEKLFTGFPEYKFALNGLKLYDPSKDSTVGGTGTQRESNPSTWLVSHNPVVQTRALFRGIAFQGKWFYGLQNLPAARLPADAWIKQIRKADVSNASTGNQPIYRAGGEVQISAPVSDAIAELMTTCQGRISETGGFYKPHIGIYDEAVASFSDSDIVSTEEQSFTPFFGLADTINGVIGKYPAPKDGWNLKAAPPIYRPDFEVEDGNRRLMTEITLTFVPYPAQVQRLLNAAIKEARRARRVTLVLPPSFYGIEAGDVLLDTSERNGFDLKRFRVDGAADKANLDTMVDLTEIDPADYSFNHGTDYRVPVDGGIKAVTLTAQAMDGWHVSPSEIVDANGIGRRPAILVEAADDLDDVRNVRVWVRLASTKAVVFDSDQYAYSAPFAWRISEALLPATAYEVSGLLIPFSARPTLQSAWLPVTTYDIRFSAEDLHLAQVSQAINTELAQHIDWIWRDDNIRLLIESRKSVSVNLAAQDLANYTDKKQLKREIVSKTGKLQARFQEQIDVATSETAALVQRVVTFEAELDLKASAQLVETTIARVAETEEGLVAVSGRVTEIEVEILGKADASLVETLKTEVKENADGISALSARQLELSAEVQGKASADLVQTTIARVTTSENEISSLSQDMVSLATSLSDKIGSSVFSSLASEVSDIGGVVTLQGDILNEIELELDDKASFLALSTLTGTVTQQGDMITSQGELIDSISAKVGDISADARMRFEVVNANGTGYSLIGLQARFGTQEDYRSAGLFIKVPSDPNQQSEVIVNSGLFAVTTGNDETGQRIFLVDDGKVYLDSAYIKNITTDKVTFLENSVDGDTLALGAAQSIYDNAAVTGVTVTTTFQSVLSVSAPKTETSRIKVLADIRVRATTLVSGKATLLVELWENDGTGDAVVKDTTLTFTDVVNSQAPTLYYYRRTGAGTFTYKIVVKKTASGEDFQIGRRTLTAEAPKRVSS